MMRGMRTPRLAAACSLLVLLAACGRSHVVREPGHGARGERPVQVSQPKYGATAVVQRGQGAIVFVVADNKARQVSVQLGKRMEGKVEVKEGIAAGDVVVTAGNARLSDGVEVEVVSAAAAVAE